MQAMNKFEQQHSVMSNARQEF